MNAVAVQSRGRVGTAGRGSLGRGFWVQWVVASAVAASVGSTLGGFLGEAARGVIFETLGFTVVGLVVGTGQWLALGRHVPQTGWYIVATTAGYSLIGLAAGTMGWIFGGETGWGMVGAQDVAVRFAVGGTVAGFVVGAWLGTVDGVLQWFSLRRHVSGWFVPASIFGEALGGAASFTLAAVVGVAAGDVLQAASVFIVGGATAGAIVGGAMILLFGQSNRSASARSGAAKPAFRLNIGLALPVRHDLPRVAAQVVATVASRAGSPFSSWGGNGEIRRAPTMGYVDATPT